MKIHLFAIGMLIAVSLAGSEGYVRAAGDPRPIGAKKFDALADAALAAMTSALPN